MFDVKNGTITLFNERVSIGMNENEIMGKIKDHIMLKEKHIDAREIVFLKEFDILDSCCYAELSLYRQKVQTVSFSVRPKSDEKNINIKEVADSFNNKIKELVPDVEFDSNGTFDYKEGEYKLSSSFNRDGYEYTVFLTKI